MYLTQLKIKFVGKIFEDKFYKNINKRYYFYNIKHNQKQNFFSFFISNKIKNKNNYNSEYREFRTFNTYQYQKDKIESLNFLKKVKRFYSINNNIENSNISFLKLKKMSLNVPQVISLDPTVLPVNYTTPINDINIVLKDSVKECCNFDDDIVIFLVHSKSDKDNGNMKIGSQIKDSKINEFLSKNEDIFNGKLGTFKSFYISNDKNKYINLSFIRCGTIDEEMSEFEIRKIVSSLVQILHDNKSVATSIIFEIGINESLFRFFLETVFYEYVADERFKSTDKVDKVDNKSDGSGSAENMKSLEIFLKNYNNDYVKQVDKSRTYFMGTYFASQLISAPSNYCNPVSLANVAVELAEKLNLECKILGVKELEELKMGAYLSVGKGSMYPNRFIHLTYKGKGDIKKKIALVGKGITFDSGGYNLKASPGSMIDLMKFDMSGCAAVLGCAYCIGSIKPENVQVHFLSAVCENMVSKNSYRPGDIITASNGKTIEVGNTDAEGRLTLADALVYAEKIGVDHIIDIATLTGAMLYSLGTSYAGVFGNDNKLINKILESSETSNEPVWWLPIIKEYRESLNSKYADINNISSNVKASSVVASLFLKEFIKSTSWAHIDIAGVAWNFKDRKPKGFGVRLLSEFILNHSI
ncbi:chromosome condensation regulator leucine aminopeptidase [Plasmodium yoelii]|uniref:Leucine aminopeptidase n=3 Tax=Plasmodium yoelii TaxID=5861 RepID=A0AAE9WWK3_PLAYO|nr:chromosome condensation regulator leucine aminopeptidase [Plasmodium yoelii]EAA21300.1 putative leucine aminopeptidase [Plasmodium yoelii yoelii]WBY59799.1 M17 leucyl aminopeptidase [Plasmodium yoelii yoelii]CDU19758.1 M17 leucyl aminopeptidase, putative [Plasmodium yoelii]VTZ80515.1 M17 leucyl aminopeptidase, putative [Plasmodium yoelii]|eukprot:XP_729735.1 chromosome condensation regulator leucine aminopeptidase [Plasmodium yoelii]